MTPGVETVEALRAAARAIGSATTSVPDEARAVRVAINALTARESELLADMADMGIAEAEGASSVSTWARRELHQDAGTTRSQVRAAHALRDLPAVAAAARRGAISARHLQSFGYAMRFLGSAATSVLEEPLLEIALHTSPEDFHCRVREIRATYHPDDLDRAWLRGMDKADVQLSRTLDGWHLTGFLPIDVGAKLKAILDNLSVPRHDGDTRAPATRRIEALDDVLTTVTENGLPSDNGIRPHLHVVVRDDRPVELDDFGPIGPVLATLIGCGADLTPYLVNPAGDITAVGRSKRHATGAQIKAIRLRQAGRCAREGCHHPIAHIHHITYWANGGHTNLDNLEGLCRTCHTLTHRHDQRHHRHRPVEPHARTG